MYYFLNVVRIFLGVFRGLIFGKINDSDVIIIGLVNVVG